MRVRGLYKTYEGEVRRCEDGRNMHPIKAAEPAFAFRG